VEIEVDLRYLGREKITAKEGGLLELEKAVKETKAFKEAVISKLEVTKTMLNE